MAKTTFASLGLKLNKDVEIIHFGDKPIEVKKYLPIEEKYDLITITLQQSLEEGIFNPVKLEIFFNLNIVFMYTDLVFTEKQKEDLSKLYDLMESNGLFDLVIAGMNPQEYQWLRDTLEEARQATAAYTSSTSSVVKDLITNLPKAMEEASGFIDNFNKNKYAEIVDYAKAIGAKV